MLAAISYFENANSNLILRTTQAWDQIGKLICTWDRHPLIIPVFYQEYGMSSELKTETEARCKGTSVLSLRGISTLPLVALQIFLVRQEQLGFGSAVYKPNELGGIHKRFQVGLGTGRQIGAGGHI